MNTEEKNICMSLDKYGIFNCTRHKNHENNSGDKYSKYHWCYLNGIKWTWVGHGDSKPEIMK